MVQITHVKHQGGSADHHLALVRWYNPSTGTGGDAGIPQMVEFLRNSANRAYICNGTRIVDLKVVEARPPYIRSVADGQVSDNLSTLPKLP